MKNKELMHKYWCHKSEALKSNCNKPNQFISPVDLEFRPALQKWQEQLYHSLYITG